MPSDVVQLRLVNPDLSTDVKIGKQSKWEKVYDWFQSQLPGSEVVRLIVEGDTVLPQEIVGDRLGARGLAIVIVETAVDKSVSEFQLAHQGKPYPGPLDKDAWNESLGEE